jgi:hypothetical protein
VASRRAPSKRCGRDRLQSLHGGEASLDQQSEFVVKTEAVLDVRDAAAVSAGKKTHPCAMRAAGDPQSFLKFVFATGDIFRNIDVDNEIVFPRVAILLRDIFRAPLSVASGLGPKIQLLTQLTQVASSV